MKKALLLLLAVIFLSAPALVIYSSMKNSAATMQAEAEKQLLHRMQNELQRQDILVNPVIEIYRKLFMALRRTREESFMGRYEDEVNAELLDFLKGLMQETTSMWFGGEASLLYRQNSSDHLLNIINGKNAHASSLEEFIRHLRRYQQNMHMPQIIAEVETAIKSLMQSLELYFNISIMSTGGDSDRIQRVVTREHGSLQLFMLLRLRAAFIMSFLADLSAVDDNARAEQKVANWQHQAMGLAFMSTRDHNTIATSDFFNAHQHLRARAASLLQVSGEGSITRRWQNYLLLVSRHDPKKPHRILIAARAPSIDKQPRMILLTVFFAILGCFIGKILVENIVLGRGRDVSLLMFVIAIFVMVTMLPFLSSAFLANEYIAANFKNEKNRAVNELAQDIVDLDVKTRANLRFSINFARSLKTVEKIAEFAEMPDSASINELLLKTSEKLQHVYGRTVFSNLWVYDESQPIFSVLYDRDKKLFRHMSGANAGAEDYFINRYKTYMRLQNPETQAVSQVSPTDDIKIDELKVELLDSFILNMFGSKTYYKIREDFGSLVWKESFMDTNALLTIPVTHKGRTKYIITWVFDSAGIRDMFPRENLRVDKDNPLVTIFGNDQYIGARPFEFPRLSKEFPTLVELGNQSLITGSRLFMQDYIASGAPIFEARPARHSDFIICGSRFTRSVDSITGELVAETLRYFAWIAVSGIVLALLTSLYFTIPIRQLTRATRQIAEGNYAVRLDQSHPDEFAVAAATFNKMAIGLQQGELLSSFVSESVKEIASREQLSSSDIAFNTSATVLFSSIKDFHTLQQHEAEKIFEILQAHLSAAVAATAKHGGEIDKMIEDKIMIVFDSSRQNEYEQVNAAIATAISIKQAMQQKYALHTAAGITTGEVVSGVMGAGNVRLSKTVVGDTVNLAARLAAIGAGMPHGSVIASSNSIRSMSADYHGEKLPISQVKGKTQAVEAYQVTLA